MRSQDVREFLRAQPFQPFRLTLTDGRTYDVRHPELAMVGRSIMAVGVPSVGEDEPIFDRLVTVSLPHIIQAEPINAQNKPA